jgi:hypothetical protein
VTFDRLFPEMDHYQLQMMALKKRASDYLKSVSKGSGSSVEVAILNCNGLKLPQSWKKPDLDLFFHTVHDTPEQRPNMPPIEIWARCFIAGWRIQRNGVQRVDAATAAQFPQGTTISPYCSGKTPPQPPSQSIAPPGPPGLPMAPPPMPRPGPPPPAPTAAATKPSVALREYIGGGDIMDPNKTLSENSVQSGDRFDSTFQTLPGSNAFLTFVFSFPA